MAPLLDDLVKPIVRKAAKNINRVPRGWLPATRIRSFIFNDPVGLWLDLHGEAFNFQPDSSPYDYLEFHRTKSRQFDARWIEEFAPEAVRVCSEPYQATYREKLQETVKRMLQGSPVIATPALWWESEKIYGMPDLLVHSAWLSQTFPQLLTSEEAGRKAPSLGRAGETGHYLVFDLKFSTNLAARGKDLENYAAQVRIYSFILGNIQGIMPSTAYLIGRDSLDNPLPIIIAAQLGSPLDADLADFRNRYIEIFTNGANQPPWEDLSVANNPKNPDEIWRTAKRTITRELTPGGDPAILYQITPQARGALNQLQFPDLRSLLASDPQQVPLEMLGNKIAQQSAQIRAILQANRSHVAVLAAPEHLPPRKQFEFFVDFEAFRNINVDFVKQWPTLAGYEMLYLVGVAWESAPGKIEFQSFMAAKENLESEQVMLNQLLAFLDQRTGGRHTDSGSTAIYAWGLSEKVQSAVAASRQGWDEAHPLRKLPWIDLQSVFLECQGGIPGAWDVGLKEIAIALGKYDSRFDAQWLGDLDDGLSLSVLGWRYYAKDPDASQAMEVLQHYQSADCRGMAQILRWMRSNPPISTEKPFVGWEKVRKSLAAPEVKHVFAGLNEPRGLVIYELPVSGKKLGKVPLNQLIWGDRVELLDQTQEWCKVRARNTTGWVHRSQLQDDAILEINFIDVGQGDGCFIVTPDEKYILVDAGEEDHMYRFLRWYFKHFQTEVTFDAAIITHPDADHYKGFTNFFDEKDPAVRQLRFCRLYHNGIVNAKTSTSLRQGVVRTHEQLVDYLAQGSNAGLYINLLKTSIASGRVEKTEMLFAPRTGQSFVPGYEAGQDLSIQVLGPVPLDDSDPPRLKFLENEGVTKNGHSVILKMKYKQVSILLGGDLNSASEAYLMDHYARQAFPSNQPLTSQQLVSGTRQFFEVDIAKACHHGSADFTNEFLQAINALCTVISSGDEESYSHPRPESLGAVGRFGRGIRPLIFSTELARSSPEKIKDPFELQEKLILAQSKERVSEFTEDLIEKLGRTVAVYGMITLRTDGNRVMLAQKLEQPRSKSQKWDMHFLTRDSQGKLIYQPDA